MVDQPGDITQLLLEARQGDPEAANHLYDAVYDELRRIARGRLSRNRAENTLNTTALVHEAYLRLVDQAQAAANDRAHFFALASRAMRFVLIDYARRRTAQKRGGVQRDISLDEVRVGVEDRTLDLLALDEALDELTAFDERLGRLVEFRFFGGLTYEEIAEVTEWSVPTIKRDWRRARAWLFRAMQPGAP
jgi:RNA polymerase sigma factor (TIGR02999 family)